MKHGLELPQLAAEIYRQAENKRDFIDTPRKIKFNPNVIELSNEELFGINDLAHNQIANFTGIPRKYYDKMLADAGENESTVPNGKSLLERNVQHWFDQSTEQRMVRTLDGNVRAFLSNKYRPLDNIDLAEAVLPALQEQNVQIVSADITERRLYIKFVDPSLRGQVNWGSGNHSFRKVENDEIVWGGVITNSEVGAGSLTVSSMFVRSFCDNTAIVGQDFRKMHMGRAIGSGDGSEYFADDTRAADDHATFLKVRDTVKGVLTETAMAATIEKLEGATEKNFRSPEKAVEVTKKVIGLSEDEGKSVLAHLINGGDLSQWGLMNAVTRTAEDSKSYDRATELESIGFNVINLTSAQWREIEDA